MGFDALYRELGAVEGAPEALRRLLQMPALVAALRANYVQAGVYKPILKARIRALLQRLQKGEPLADAGPMQIHARAQELADRLVLYEHAADVDVRRWARIALELRADPEALTLLCSFCDAKLAPFVQSVTSWIVSECNRRGCPMRPLAE